MQNMNDDINLEARHVDITTLDVDAIVNTANESLSGGGGADGCPTGEARLTRGYRLPTRYVIHTDGPIWHGGTHGAPELLARCYRNSLLLAEQQALASIAFPAISCGVYGYPADQATQIAVLELRAYRARGGSSLRRVTFACFGEKMLALYECTLSY